MNIYSRIKIIAVSANTICLGTPVYVSIIIKHTRKNLEIMFELTDSIRLALYVSFFPGVLSNLFV